MGKIGSLLHRYALVVCLVSYVLVLLGLHKAGRFPRPGLYDISRLSGAPSLVFEGRILDFPTIRWNQTRFLFEARAIPQSAFHGRTLATLTFPRPDLRPGDRLRLRGWLSTPRPASFSHPFDEKRYWEGYRTYSLLKVWSEDQCQTIAATSPWAWRVLAGSFQRRFQNYWVKTLPPDEAGLLLGITIGGRGRLSQELKAACIRAGVYHIAVVSGQNVALIITLCFLGLNVLSVPKKYLLWICAGPLLFYATLVGGDPPVVRAVVSALVGLLAVTLRRDVPRIYLFAWAALTILVISPEALFGASFQLSFGATASLLAFSPWLDRLRHIRPRVLQWILEAGVVCLVVYIGVWPLLVYYFHRISLVGLLANWTVFPLAGLLLVMGLVIGSVGMWAPAVVPVLAIRLTHGVASMTVYCIRALAQPDWAVMAVRSPGWIGCGMYYSLLFCILLVFHRRSKRRTYASKNSPISAHRPHLQRR